MTLEEVIKYFGGSLYKVGTYKIDGKKVFSIQSPYNWRNQGFIPIHTQMKIEVLTNGKLKANLNDDWSIR